MNGEKSFDYPILFEFYSNEDNVKGKQEVDVVDLVQLVNYNYSVFIFFIYNICMPISPSL